MKPTRRLPLFAVIIASVVPSSACILGGGHDHSDAESSTFSVVLADDREIEGSLRLPADAVEIDVLGQSFVLSQPTASPSEDGSAWIVTNDDGSMVLAEALDERTVRIVSGGAELFVDFAEPPSSDPREACEIAVAIVDGVLAAEATVAAGRYATSDEAGGGRFGSSATLGGGRYGSGATLGGGRSGSGATLGGGRYGSRGTLGGGRSGSGATLGGGRYGSGAAHGGGRYGSAAVSGFGLAGYFPEDAG
ncbi:MAG: hypothetical protein HYY06_13280 [Deltaproteobacteria bacterium]|nr:hypothetical protein [Deltaproteobacteria bacterium]